MRVTDDKQVQFTLPRFRMEIQNLRAFPLFDPTNILGTCQKLAGGMGGGNFKFGFGNEVTDPCNGSGIC